MSTDDPNPDRRPVPFGEPLGRERYFEKTVRGVTVATLQDRYDDDAWVRSTLVVDVEP